jgi:hypothetical protein
MLIDQPKKVFSFDGSCMPLLGFAIDVAEGHVFTIVSDDVFLADNDAVK